MDSPFFYVGSIFYDQNMSSSTASWSSKLNSHCLLKSERPETKPLSISALFLRRSTF